MTVDLDRIAALVESARGQADELTFVYEHLSAALPGARCEPHVCNVDEYVISVGLGKTRFAPEIEALISIAPLDLAIAPRIAGVYSTDQCQVLARRYAACAGEPLHRVYGTDVRIGAPQRAAFRRELERLATAGYMHAGAHRNVTYWLYGETSKTLVLANWAMLQPLEERDAIFDSIDYYLQERAA